MILTGMASQIRDWEIVAKSYLQQKQIRKR